MMRQTLRRLFVGGLAWIGALTVVGLLTILVIASQLLPHKKAVPAKTILEIDFTRGVQEQSADDPVTGWFTPRTPTVRDVVETLQRASTDERVVALIAHVGTAPGGLAQMQELRDAVLAFRSTGKRAVAYAATFGEFAAGTGAYYLATAFDTIYLQPAGDVGLTGLMAETPFIRGVLDKLDIVPRLAQRQEYKNFLNTFTERHYTAPHREATQRVMESQFGQIVQGIALARQLDAEAVRRLIDRGPFLGPEAIEARLVDRLAYRDEVYAELKTLVGVEAKLLYLGKYLAYAGRPHHSGTTMALIYGVGAVQLGGGGHDPLRDGPTMGSEPVSAAFRAAIDDPDVRAILFRVDSPGGSYVASDTIWRETVRAREAGKPVIVSMGDVAGSGGYFVAMAANKIVAQPGTITGSIGVLAGKMFTKGLWDKLGLTWDEVHTSANATLWSGAQDYTPEQWARLQSWLDRVYDDFTSRVAAGRQLDKAHVQEIAKGRIWTGEDAKAHGLVDALGGFPTALHLAREALGLPPESPVRLKLFPERSSRLAALLERVLGAEDESSEPDDVAMLNRVRQWVRPVLQTLRVLGLTAPSGVLTMPDVRSH